MISLSPPTICNSA